MLLGKSFGIEDISRNKGIRKSCRRPILQIILLLKELYTNK